MSDSLTGEKTGIGTVVREEFDPRDPVPGQAQEQMPLPLRKTGAAQADANEVLAAEGAGRGPGRPKGAKNKNTEAWRNYLLHRYESPLVALAEVYSRPVAELAADLGLKARPTYEQALELMKIQLQCAKELAPYVHQKQPMAVEASGDGLMQLIIQPLAASPEQVENAGEMAINFIDVESVENQSLSASENSDLDAPDLDVSRKRADGKEEKAQGVLIKDQSEVTGSEGGQ